uniref:Uncharacterized protein n=1 Tax=Arundo donax TaxID=35708 RepID=A0A0A9CSJ6_ARUDO
MHATIQYYVTSSKVPKECLHMTHVRKIRINKTKLKVRSCFAKISITDISSMWHAHFSCSIASFCSHAQKRTQ